MFYGIIIYVYAKTRIERSYFMEILSPAGSLKSAKASVLAGASAIYMGFGEFNARRQAENFSKEEFSEAIDFAKKYDVLVYITLNIILTDKELKKVYEFIEFLASLNIDGIIVQDLGVLELIKKVCPTMPVHASTQLTIHNLEGAIKAKELGFSRVVLSRELSFENIKHITENCGIETEVFVHGALCMCYSGQCYLSSLLGSRSGNRGLCAQPCRLPYKLDGKTSHPLSLKDLSLVEYVEKLKDAGVSCLKIEGRMKRHEYTYVVTKIYSDVLRENRMPTREELETLRLVFSRQGFTDGYFKRELGKEMFGTKSDNNPRELTELYDKIAKELHEATINFPVSFEFVAKRDEKIKLIAKNGTNIVELLGDTPEIAINKATDYEQVKKSLSKTGGTIFSLENIEISLDDGLRISASSINNLRREALEKLEILKTNYKKREVLPIDFKKSLKNKPVTPMFTVEITDLSQITDSMYVKKPEILYIPIGVISRNLEKISSLIQSGFNICAKLPKIVHDHEMQKYDKLLEKLKELGINKILTSNIGFVYSDFEVYGDFGLNVYNSLSLDVLKNMGVSSQMLSFELKSAQIRDILKPIPTELMFYGKLPLMVFENCIISPNYGRCACKEGKIYLTDRKNEKFYIQKEFGCRNTLYNNKPIYLLDKMDEFSLLGVTYLRLSFADEDASQVEFVYKSHIENKLFETDFTRGLYYRGAL